MIIGREITGTSNATTSANSSNTVLAARVTEGCTNPNCKAKKRSTYTTANCYWPGGGKEGQFPPNFGQRNRVNVAAGTVHPLLAHPVLLLLPSQNTLFYRHGTWIPLDDQGC